MGIFDDFDRIDRDQPFAHHRPDQFQCLVDVFRLSTIVMIIGKSIDNNSMVWVRIRLCAPKPAMARVTVAPAIPLLRSVSRILMYRERPCQESLSPR